MYEIKPTNLPRVRGIKAALDEIRKLDPETAVSERGLRRLILQGEVPSIRIGTKFLINLDALYSYLSVGSQAQASMSATESGSIRRVTE